MEIELDPFVWSWDRPKDPNAKGYLHGVKLCGGKLYLVVAKREVMEGENPPCPGCDPDNPRWTKVSQEDALAGAVRPVKA